MRVQDYVVLALESKPNLTIRQLADAIRRDYRYAAKVSSIQYALERLRVWGVVGRERKSCGSGSGYIHWLRHDYREGLKRQDEVRIGNISRALEKNRQRNKVRETDTGEDNPCITERKPRVRQPIEQYGEPARMQKLFDSLLKKARNNAG